MGNAQLPPSNAPPPIADTSSISATQPETQTPNSEPSKKVVQIPDAADAAVAPDGTDGTNVASGVSPSASSARSPADTPVDSSKVSTADSMGQAMRKLEASKRKSAFVKSKKLGKLFFVDHEKGFPEVLLIGSPELNGRLRAAARKKGKPLKQHQIDQLNMELASAAEEEGLEADIHTRVSPKEGGGVEIDLCDGKGTTVQVTQSGVQEIPGTSEQLFIRSGSMLALPAPLKLGDFKLLRKYINLDYKSFLRYIAWVSFTVAGPKIEATKYVFLVITAPQGAGKTLSSKITKSVIDPNTVTAQMLPGSPRDLAIMLQSVHLLVVDNMRDLSTLISDTLCVAATGGSIPQRKLYSDDEQKTLYLHGAILLNGIHPFLGQSDFADRCMVLELRQIAPGARKSEAQMLAEFQLDLPSILGGLYELISKILQLLPMAKILAPSRMLDFCRWLAAMELALQLEPGELQYPYAESLRNAQLESLLDNPLAATILEFAENMEGQEWVGTPTDFYERLGVIAGFSSQRSRAWPTSAAVLSKRLHGLQAPLLAQGISIDWTRGKDRQIIVRTKTGEKT